jgi:kinetochore protein Nuf2
MDNLQAEFEHAKQERNRKNATADAKNIESEKIEAKMAELEEAYEAYQKKMVRQKDAIETAVRLYISTLTNSLQLERFPA